MTWARALEDEQVEYLKFLSMLYLQMLCAFLFSLSIQSCVHSYVPWMGSYKDKTMSDYHKVSTEAIKELSKVSAPVVSVK